MTLLDAEPILRTTPPWLFSITCSQSELTDLSWELQQTAFADGVVRTIRGAKMKGVVSLFDEISSALQFPDYFGENWDALDECLNDLEWLPGRSFLLLVADALAVLSEEAEKEFETFVGLLMRTGEEWASRRIEGEPWDRPQAPFHVVMHCLEREEDELAHRIRAAGGEILPLAVKR